MCVCMYVCLSADFSIEKRHTQTQNLSHRKIFVPIFAPRRRNFKILIRTSVINLKRN